MIIIKASVSADDFTTAKRMITECLDSGLDFLTLWHGSAGIEVEERDDDGEIIGTPNYSQLYKGEQ